MMQRELPLPPQEQRDILKALDALLTERIPALPAPIGITQLQPLEPPCIAQHRSLPL
jgi:hypothetical protein